MQTTSWKHFCFSNTGSPRFTSPHSATVQSYDNPEEGGLNATKLQPLQPPPVMRSSFAIFLAGLPQTVNREAVKMLQVASTAFSSTHL